MTRAEHIIDLVTPRMRLHPLSVEEGSRIVDEAPDDTDQWAEAFPMQDDRDGIRGYLTAASAGDDPAPFGCYRIDLDEAAVGTIGFFGPPDENGEVMFGYGLTPKTRGFGYATEALGRLVEFCRAHEDVRVMVADTDKGNIASQRVLVKNGFELVREDDALLYYRLDVVAR